MEEIEQELCNRKKKPADKEKRKAEEKGGGSVGGGWDSLYIVYPCCWVRPPGPAQHSSASMSVFMSVSISSISAQTHTYTAHTQRVSWKREYADLRHWSTSKRELHADGSEGVCVCVCVCVRMCVCVFVRWGAWAHSQTVSDINKLWNVGEIACHSAQWMKRLSFEANAALQRAFVFKAPQQLLSPLFYFLILGIN